MNLLDDRAEQDLEIASFAQRHPQFFAHVVRGIKCLPAEAGEGLTLYQVDRVWAVRSGRTHLKCLRKVRCRSQSILLI